MKYLVCLLILISSSVYAGAIYKWDDEGGNTHYGDAPPISVDTEEVNVDVAPSNPGKPLPRLETSAPESGTTDSTSPDSAQPDPEMPDDQAEVLCKEAHLEIRYLNNAKHRARVINPDGSSTHMSTEDRKARRELAKQDIEAYCK